MAMLVAESTAQERTLKKIYRGIPGAVADLTIMRAVRSCVGGIAFLKQKKPLAESFWPSASAPAIRDIWKALITSSKKLFLSVPYPITKGLDATDEIAAARRTEVRHHKPEAFVDTKCVGELDKSGFIKKRYDMK